MNMLQDSIATTEADIEATPHAPKHLSVAQILSSLPSDATPQQQDSAVQAHQKPVVIHYSGQPDTLHIPGLPFNVPSPSQLDRVVYKEGFFANDSTFQTGLTIHKEGMTADPIPYQLRTDNSVTGIIFIYFIFAMIVFIKSRTFIAHSIHDFFRNRERNNVFSIETGSEYRYQAFLFIQTCVIWALMFFDYTQENLTDVFGQISPYVLLGLNGAIILSFQTFRLLIYSFINWIFFRPAQNSLFMRGYLLVTSLTGLALFPLILLVVYFDLGSYATWVYFAIVTILAKILLFFKSYSIFFHKNYGSFYLIVYFCSVELMSDFVLVKTLIMANNSLVIKF